MKYFRKSIYLFIALLLIGCATYYTKNISFQEKLQDGDLEKADKMLENDKKWQEGKNKVLYYLNRGYINWLLQNFEESNKYFSAADIIIEDNIKSYGTEILALMINPTVKPYRVEDFENVILNYFKALNYLSLNNYDDALVEVRKINNKLNVLNDKYPVHKNKYGRDAFAHLIMGLIYDAKNDYNNAFIAYRNAYEVYIEDYQKLFQISIPDQLKLDLMRTAYLTGFSQELRDYEKEFNLKYNHEENNNPSAVFFWLNGFGPVKAEWSINFTALPGKNGVVTFANSDYGLSFPIYTGNYGAQEKAALSDLSFLRIAFPKYVERKPYYTHASLTDNNGNIIKLELAQDINKIAFTTLQDRMIREISNSIGRLAVKKGMEAIAKKQNPELGTIVSLANALTEKADTRNWQSLPYSISYSRIPIGKGENKIQLKTFSNGHQQSHTFNLDASNENKTQFLYFHSLESTKPAVY